jgi:hypothetical protein
MCRYVYNMPPCEICKCVIAKIQNVFNFPKTNLGLIKKDEMGRAYGRNKRNEKCIQNVSQKLLRENII